MTKKELKKLVYLSHPKKIFNTLWDLVKDTPVLSRIYISGPTALAVHDEGTDFTYTAKCFSQDGEIMSDLVSGWSASSSDESEIAIEGVTITDGVLSVADTVPVDTIIYVAAYGAEGTPVSNIKECTVSHADASVYEALVPNKETDTLEIPVAGETSTETYTVEARSQYEIEMPTVNYANVTWSIPIPVAGATIGAHTGVLTLDGDLIADAGDVVVHASYQIGTVTKTCDITVTLEYAESVATSITVVPSSATPPYPLSGQITPVTHIATVLDQYGEEMAEQEVVFTLEGTATGCTIDDETGTVSISDTAVSGATITVKATLGDIDDTCTFVATKLTPVLTTLEITGNATPTLLASGTATEDYTAAARDQYDDAMPNTGDEFTVVWSLGTPISDVSVAPKGGSHTLVGTLSMLDTAGTGSTTVVATCGAVSDSLPVVVTDHA